MSKFIDVDALLSNLIFPSNTFKQAFTDILYDEPDAEVKPIVYGNWVPVDDEPHEDFECDRCGYIICGEEFATNFCPNCGADMRKEREVNNERKRD